MRAFRLARSCTRAPAARFQPTATRFFASPSDDNSSFQVVVVGAGPGGLAMASTLQDTLGPGRVCLVDPATDHAYQPGWTFVGAGKWPLSKTIKPLKPLLPSQTAFINAAATEFHPEANSVVLSDGKTIKYDHLIVATGLVSKYEKANGMLEALEDESVPVSTNYDRRFVEKTFRKTSALKAGQKAMFSFPHTVVKCPGAPQKIMYLTEYALRENNLRDMAGPASERVEVQYNSALPVLFGVPKYAAALQAQCDSRGIQTNLNHKLVAIRGDQREADFEVTTPAAAGAAATPPELKTESFDFLHVVPPLETPDAVQKSALANAAGFVDVDKATLRHVKFDNVWSLGDCSSLPTSKTAAAVSAESGVLRRNLMAAIEGKPLSEAYDGYTSCPIPVGGEKLILAEFGYDGKIMETLPWDQSKPSMFAASLKSVTMPAIYWNSLLSGRWEGPAGLRKILNPFNL